MGFSKLRPGTLIVADASGGPVPATSTATVNLRGRTSFTPIAGRAYTLEMEARGTLAAGAGPCDIPVAPLVNGRVVNFTDDGWAILCAPAGDPDFPSGEPAAGLSAAVGLTQPGSVQQISVRVFGDPDCTAGSTEDAVRVVVDQAG